MFIRLFLNTWLLKLALVALFGAVIWRLAGLGLPKPLMVRSLVSSVCDAYKYLKGVL